MVIVDMGLSDVRPITLVKAIREAKPAMRLVLIPLFGQQIPPELQALKIQGILPKPFFVGDLPQIVAKAMGTESTAPPAPESKVAVASRHGPPPAREAQPAPAAGRQPVAREEAGPTAAVAPGVETPVYSPETVAKLQAKEPQIVQLLKSLNREIRAESIIVTLGPHLIASAGLLNRAQSANLAALVAASTEAAARLAAFLGEPDARFEQSLHEGAEYRLYSLSLSEGLVLSLALSSDVPLGTLRYRARQAAEELLELFS
jgi:predicted regulator of Ras-like GTPase activity (Roadblock/LC7/MglB family)